MGLTDRTWYYHSDRQVEEIAHRHVCAGETHRFNILDKHSHKFKNTRQLWGASLQAYLVIYLLKMHKGCIEVMEEIEG